MRILLIWITFNLVDDPDRVQGVKGSRIQVGRRTININALNLKAD
jgi:hypothetical protein